MKHANIIRLNLDPPSNTMFKKQRIDFDILMMKLICNFILKSRCEILIKYCEICENSLLKSGSNNTAFKKCRKDLSYI